MIALIAVLGVLTLLLLIPFALAGFGFWVWMLIHAIRNDHLSGTSRVLWAALVWFLLTGDSPAKLAADQQQRWAR